MRKYVFINYQSSQTGDDKPVKHEERATEADYADLLRRERKLRDKTRMRHSLYTVLSTAAVIALFFVFKPETVGPVHSADIFGETYSNWVSLDNSEGTETVYNKLPDGTKVFLAAGATVMLSPDFAAGNRDVLLNGSAHFDVARNEEMPLRITTPDNNVVTVLGTSFFINTAFKDSLTTVALERGSVSLTMGNGPHKGKSFTMNPGDMTTIDGADALLSTIPSDFYEKYDFTRAWLDFHNTKCSEVIGRVEQFYDVKFNIYCHNILNYSFTGNLNDLTVREILDLFKYSMGIRYTYNDDNIVLYGKY